MVKAAAKTKKTKPRKLKLSKKGIVKRKKTERKVDGGGSRRIRCSALPKIKCAKARPCAWSVAKTKCYRAPPPFQSNARSMVSAAAKWRKLAATPEARARKARMPWIEFYKAHLRGRK